MAYKPWSQFGSDHAPSRARSALQAVQDFRDKNDVPSDQLSIYGSLTDPYLPFTEHSDIDLLIEGGWSYEQQKELRSAARDFGCAREINFHLVFRSRSEIKSPNMLRQLRQTDPEEHPLLLVIRSTLRSIYQGVREAQSHYLTSTKAMGESRVLDDDDPKTTTALLYGLQRSLCHTTNALLRRLLYKIDGANFIGKRMAGDTDNIHRHFRDMARDHPGIRPPVLSEETVEAFEPYIQTLKKRATDPAFEDIQPLYSTLPTPLRYLIRDLRSYKDFLKDHLERWPTFKPVTLD